MSSSGYTAITFVANEQPTTAKWNLIGSNDASFNTGAGFNDSILAQRHFGSNSVPALALDTAALYLGSVTNSGLYSSASTIPTLVTGMTLAITIPAGGRRTKLTLYAAGAYMTGATGDLDMAVWDGTVGGANRLFDVHTSGLPLSNPNTATGFTVVSPAAGAKTYNVSCQVNGGGGGTANIQVPVTLLAEAV